MRECAAESTKKTPTQAAVGSEVWMVVDNFVVDKNYTNFFKSRNLKNFNDPQQINKDAKRFILARLYSVFILEFSFSHCY